MAVDYQIYLGDYHYKYDREQEKEFIGAIRRAIDVRPIIDNKQWPTIWGAKFGMLWQLVGMFRPQIPTRWNLLEID